MSTFKPTFSDIVCQRLEAAAMKSEAEHVAELRRDAERYRWLRLRLVMFGYLPAELRRRLADSCSEEDVDALIDVELAKRVRPPIGTDATG